MSGPGPGETGSALTVIVLTYNSASSIDDCLDALEPQVAALDGQLLIVDNDSGDDTVQRVVRRGHPVHQTGANLGFAAGCNAGAATTDAEVLVFVNPDTVLDPGCLQALLRPLDDPGGWGPVGGRARHADGSYDQRCVLGQPSLIGALAFALGLDAALRDSLIFGADHGPTHLVNDGRTVVVPAVSGALFAVPRGLWCTLEGFDERYFLYGEDVDLCRRAAAHGWRPAVATGAGYRHLGAVSSGGSPTRNVLLFRGKVELYRRHLRPPARAIATLALQFGVALRSLMALLPLPAPAERGRSWRALLARRTEWRRGFADHVRPA